MNYLQIGHGLIGKKRVAARPLSKNDYIYDTAFSDSIVDCWQAIKQVDAVVVSTPNHKLVPMALEALAWGRPCLIEKPGARTVAELAGLAPYADKIRIGFNLRYHPAMQEAKKLIDAGSIGDITHLRGVYGHGGGITGWRADPALSGGGVMIDLGVHAVDLTRWLTECEITYVDAEIEGGSWMDETDAFLQINVESIVAQWHVSATEWLNTFELTIVGTHGLLKIEGLGGSYGLESLTLAQMTTGAKGRPSTTTWTYPDSDAASWKAEMEEWAEDVRLGRKPSCGYDDAKAALQIVEEVYR